MSSMITQITVRYREVYGRPTIYPACAQSRLLAEIAGTKTLTPHALNCARKLGFTVQYTLHDLYAPVSTSITED